MEIVILLIGCGLFILIFCTHIASSYDKNTTKILEIYDKDCTPIIIEIKKTKLDKIDENISEDEPPCYNDVIN
jgi:hypothetical protein